MEILYLTHRIPFPPDKGDKIRSYNFLVKMAERWTVHLGTFVDDEADWQYVPAVEKLCGSSKFVRLNPLLSRVKAMRGFVSGSSLTTPYYDSSEMTSWIRSLVSERSIDCVVGYSSSMGQYVLPLLDGEIAGIVDFCDMDSDKWRQYSRMFRGLKRWVYGRESRYLQAEEAEIATRCNSSVFISDDESRLFCRQTGVSSHKVHTVQNGVDTEFFNPDYECTDPYDGKRDILVFVGAMDYWPNIDAVSWFVENVFPGVKRSNQDAEFYIVGSKPTQAVVDLGRTDGVTVTGRVDDVRPYLKFARLVVAPLRVARGVQNKVLEAMAMARPVVASDAALEGISFDSEAAIMVCDDVADWLGKTSQCLDSVEDAGRNRASRGIVSREYSWQANADRLADVINEAVNEVVNGTQTITGRHE